MNQAAQNKAMVNHGEWSFTDALMDVADRAEAIDQDYENETTWFEWPDGSVSQFSAIEQMILTYGSK